MKIWHDDIRPAPEGWVWCRTNEVTRHLLSTPEHMTGGNDPIEQIDLDHDMGLHDLEPNDDTIMFRGFDEDNGYELVKWMIENNLVPPVVRIHSWNVECSRKMYLLLNEHGYSCEYEPFSG